MGTRKSQWHPLLQAWEAKRLPEVSPQAHEKAWEQEPQLRRELESLRGNLEQYANALGAISGIKP